MEAVGLVPARAGSKGIPGKNLVLVGGKPLLQWTIEAAIGSETLTRVVVSTDWDEAATLSRALGAEVLERPSQLAGDETPMLGVVRHALGEVGRCDVLVLLQPTSPLRRAEHVDEAVRLLLETDADCVVSVVEVPHHFRPDSMMTLVADRLVAVEQARPSRRQEKPIVYARNGPAVLALRPDRLREDLYGGDCRPFVMEARDSIDVDGPFELDLVELLLSSR